ncbi:hypothetical protein G6F35_009353 [Rhizopus arrhizus]|nr:hypothetical protein G6F35_009353 [Rhizopus arrhizus]
MGRPAWLDPVFPVQGGAVLDGRAGPEDPAQPVVPGGAAGSAALALGTHRTHRRGRAGGRGALLPGHLVATVPAPAGATGRAGFLGRLLARTGPALHQLADGGGARAAAGGLLPVQAVAAHHHPERAGHARPGRHGDTDAGRLELGAGHRHGRQHRDRRGDDRGTAARQQRHAQCVAEQFLPAAGQPEDQLPGAGQRCSVRRHHPQHLLAGVERPG